jgi:hypothetical protein
MDLYSCLNLKVKVLEAHPKVKETTEAAGKLATSNRIAKELNVLKQRTGLGLEVNVEWLPGTVKYQNGKRLAEEVSADKIFIYAKNPEETIELVKHGFAEWILNQHTKPYRQLINKLIELFEEQQYERKEKTVEAIVGLFA